MKKPAPVLQHGRGAKKGTSMDDVRKLYHMSNQESNSKFKDYAWKRETNAPCIAVMDRLVNGIPTRGAGYPGVNCEGFCETCGWNPCERKRRMSKGVFAPITERVSPLDGKVVKLPAGVVQLRFARG